MNNRFRVLGAMITCLVIFFGVTLFSVSQAILPEGLPGPEAVKPPVQNREPVKKAEIVKPSINEWTKEFVGHTDVVHSVAFSPDGRQLASGGEGKTIKLWDVAEVTKR